jgi:hypothetical protein
MQIFALLGTLTFVIMGAVVGLRMLLLARRSGERPELYMGGGLFAYSLVAQPSFVAGAVLFEILGAWAYLAAVSVGLAATLLTFLGIYLFTWHVFRRDSSAARAIVGAAMIFAVATAGALLWSLAGSDPTLPQGGLTRALICALALNFAVAMGWTAGEALHYYNRMRRRLALGLADPTLVNRFLVWGIGCAACCSSALTMVVIVSLGMNMVTHPLPMLVTATAGVICAGAWYLSFLAPESYLRYIERRAAAQAAV